MEKTTAGDKIYLALFQPNQDRMWSGNIKKYRVVQSGTNVGQIVDMDGAPALDDHGQIFATAHSYWPSPISENRMDGIDVERGGVGDILRNRSSARNIYTYLDTNINLSHASNGFTTANASITPDLLGLLASDNAGRDKLIRFIHGYDAYDDDGNGNTDEKRDWILGAFLHSRPLVVHYASQSVIFVGSNDGMLHAFNDDSGEELWAFIPRNLLNKLQALHADVLESFVDGSPKAYISYNTDGSISQAVLIFGERRGGNHYYAIDVTNPEAPRYLWKISPDMTGYAELGQSWSIPNIGKIASGQGEKWVAFLAGGSDENQDISEADPFFHKDTDDRKRGIERTGGCCAKKVGQQNASESGPRAHEADHLLPWNPDIQQSQQHENRRDHEQHFLEAVQRDIPGLAAHSRLKQDECA
jgi:type IV pilus assembly protein PilY1